MSIGVVNVTLDFKDVQKALAKLPEELMKSSEKSVIRAGAKPILKSAQAKVPQVTGLLKKSLGITVKKPRGESYPTARIGARTGFQGKFLGVRVSKSKKNFGKKYNSYQNPFKYVHLVELGTSHSAAKPFIRPAIDAAQNEVIDAMAQGLDKHLTRVAARLAKKR
jgi:HK97 gp10 family phage protein